jgi:3-oxoacyl-[acyl-carrier-protein] synthase II
MWGRVSEPRRVVITGIGCVTPIGIGRKAYWNGLRNGESGVREIETFDVSSSPVKIAAQVRGFDWKAQLKPKDHKHVPRTVPGVAPQAIDFKASTIASF